MSHTIPIDWSVQPGNNSGSGKTTNTFSIGKGDHTYAKIKYEPIEQSDNTSYASQQADDNLSSTAAVNLAITKIKTELKYLCSLQVQNSDESQTTALQTNVDPSFSSDFATSEPSFDLSLNDPLFDELVNNIPLPSEFDDSWPTELEFDSFDQLLSPQLDMTYKDYTDMSMEQDDNNNYFPHVGMTTDVCTTTSSNHDESTTSSVDSTSDDNERDDINRRGLKKSGGPVRKLARFGNKQVVKYSDEYHDRRVKNNEAVKKSRMKAKEKQKTTETKMVELANENRSLTDRVDLLMKELQVLKSLYKELNQDLPSSAVKALERVNVR
ncbi:unnamed protein product [Adineta ricciae]|uniref:BZIP domain-containing protein n=1 Tax=Adineta ricciae TaxID=249248 RepID=A0A815N0S7_ADIRI|nr:unnamed protein product [Adineta ricciae]